MAKLTTEQWKALKEELYEHHKSVFKTLGVLNPVFLVKKEYQGFISLYSSEFNNDIVFIELLNSDNTSKPDRKLYKFKPVPNFDAVYDQGVYSDYKVPVDELSEVALKKEDIQKAVDSVTEDKPLSDMTIRDLMAILTKSPVSKKKWINDLVSEMK